MKGISVSLYSIIQVINLERESYDIEVRNGDQKGEMHFREGSLVAATTNDLSGEDAVLEILKWKSPEFELIKGVSSYERTIRTDLTGLLLEAARRQDEESLADGESSPGTGQSAGSSAADVEEPAADTVTFVTPSGKVLGGASAEAPSAAPPAGSGGAPARRLADGAGGPGAAHEARPGTAGPGPAATADVASAAAPVAPIPAAEAQAPRVGFGPVRPPSPEASLLTPLRRAGVVEPMEAEGQSGDKLPAAGTEPSAPALGAADLEDITTMARDILGDGLVSVDIFSYVHGDSLIGINSHPERATLISSVTNHLRDSLGRGGLPSLARYYMAELEDSRMLLVAPSGELLIVLVVNTMRVQLGLMLNVVLPKMLGALAQARFPH